MRNLFFVAAAFVLAGCEMQSTVDAAHLPGFFNQVPAAQSATYDIPPTAAYAFRLAATDADNDPLTYAVTTSPSHGLLTVQSDGQATYTPASGFLGTDQFQWQASDGKESSSSATITFAVTASIQPPVLAAIADVTTAEDTASGVSFTISDLDTSVQCTSAYLSATSTDNAVVLASTVVWSGSAPNCTGTFAPALNASGSATLTIRLTDGTTPVTSAFLFTVTAVNDAPVATAAAVSATEDTTYSSNGTSRPHLTGTDVEGSAVTCAKVGDPSHGAVTVNGNCSFSYVPTGDYAGSDSFTFKVNDGNADSATATVSVTVTGTNDAPTLTSVSSLTGATEDTAFTITYATLAAAANEGDVDGDTLSFRIEAISSGTLTINGGAVTAGTTILTSVDTLAWTPAGNANGSIPAFTIKAYDGTAASATAVAVNVTVAAANDAPTLTTLSTLMGATEDTAFPIAFATLAAAANDADADGDTLGFRIEAISSGTLTINGAAVTAGSSVLSSGDSLSWTPASNANGTIAAFTVKAYDGAAASATAIAVNVSVAAVNDAPTLTSITTLSGATEDTAFPISFSTLAGAANEADLDGDTLGFRVEAISSGTLTLNGSAVSAGSTLFSSGDSLSWTPASNANGTVAAFTIKAHDGTTVSASAIAVNVTLSAANDAPTLTTISTLTGATEDTAFTIAYATLAAAANEADVDGDTLSFRIEAISSGTLTINGGAVSAGSTVFSAGDSLSWMPASNANGTIAAFTVKAYDGAAASTSAITVNATVASVNDAPTLTSITTLTGAVEDTAFSIAFATLASAANEADVDGDTLSFRIEAVSSGTLTINGGAVTAGTTVLSSGDSLAWTPASNANGAIAAFTVKAYDGTAASGTALAVNVSVSAVNDTPTLTTISTLTGASEDTAFSIPYATLAGAANEADVDGDTLGFRIEAVSSGTLTINGGAVTPGSTIFASMDTLAWTPASNANGTIAAFTVKAYDGTVASATAVAVNVTVAAVNDLPVPTAIAFATNEDTTYAANGTTRPNLTGTDVEGSTLSCAKVGDVSHGTLTVNSDCTFTYAPAANYNGSDSFTFNVNDGTADSASTATGTITINAVNDAPVAVADTRAGIKDVPIYLLPVFNDTDVEGASLYVSGVSGATNGSAVIQPNTKVVLFTPTAAFTGAASFTYTVSDGSLTASATVTINYANAGAGTATIAKNSAWKYNNTNANLGSAWIDSGYNDAAWSSGTGILGSDTDFTPSTVIDIGPAGNRYTAVYFRKTVTTAAPSDSQAYVLAVAKDDGLVFYINGNEAFRLNMPAGAITFSSLASAAIGAPNENQYFNYGLDPYFFVNGSNQLATDVHQNAVSSSDLDYDAGLTLY